MAITSATTGTSAAYGNQFTTGTGNDTGPSYTSAYQSYNGFDLIWSQNQLQSQMKSVEDNIRTIETNGNLSDTEKMFNMQMAMNSWSAISNLRTNMLKSVSDTLKSVARNIN